MRILAAILTTTVLAGCTPSEKSEVESEVAKLLRDPGSAVFGPMTSGKPGVVCGSVSARNGFGGYTGLTPFYYVRETRIVRVADLHGDWEDKGREAAAFDRQGCSIGPDHERALEVLRLLYPEK